MLMAAEKKQAKEGVRCIEQSVRYHATHPSRCSHKEGGIWSEGDAFDGKGPKNINLNWSKFHL
jgi:hypothetical protein